MEGWKWKMVESRAASGKSRPSFPENKAAQLPQAWLAFQRAEWPNAKPSGQYNWPGKPGDIPGGRQSRPRPVPGPWCPCPVPARTILLLPGGLACPARSRRGGGLVIGIPAISRINCPVPGARAPVAR